MSSEVARDHEHDISGEETGRPGRWFVTWPESRIFRPGRARIRNLTSAQSSFPPTWLCLSPVRLLIYTRTSLMLMGGRPCPREGADLEFN